MRKAKGIYLWSDESLIVNVLKHTCELKFTVIDSSLRGFITNQHNDQLTVGLLAQLVENCSSITEVMGSDSLQA